MDKFYKICIVGHGFVGTAISDNIDSVYKSDQDPFLYDAEENRYKLQIVDPGKGLPIEDIKGKSFDAIFICVPTPSKDDGTIDSSIVDSVLNYIEKNVTTEIIVLKSTITPDLVDFYTQNPKVIYNPEFLTEKRAKIDFARAKFHIIGTNSRANGEFLENLYREAFYFKDAKYIHVTPAQASFIKYGINSFLATKVAWFNQFYDLVKTYNPEIEFADIVDAMGHDERIGRSHMRVPGWDGNRGFGGACFPKDIPALIHFSKAQNAEFGILKSAWNYNVYLRNLNDLLDREIAQNIHYNKID